MIRANFHTHSTWCDGKNTPRQMVEAAIAKGFTALGFSSHAMFPGPFAEAEGVLKPETIGPYFAEIRALAAEYADRLRIYAGVEADFVAGGNVVPDRRRGYAAWRPDFVIGSIHFVTAPDGAHVPVDHAPELLEAGVAAHFGGDWRAYVETYFAAVREMVSTCDFDVLGHADLVRKFNSKFPHFDENAHWYCAQVEATADAIAAGGKIVELNLGGIARGWIDDAYPSPFFRALLRARGVSFILSSDAHAADKLDFAFDRFADAEAFVEFNPAR